MLLNTLFASALSILKVHSMMYFVLLCKLLFGLNTVQTDQFSCYSSKQILEMLEVYLSQLLQAFLKRCLLYHMRRSKSADKFSHRQVHNLVGDYYFYWFDLKRI